MAKVSASKKEATATPEAGKGLRNFRHSQDIENFYRFIHDNGLQREARLMMDTVKKHLVAQRKKAEAKKKARGRKAAKKKLLQ